MMRNCHILLIMISRRRRRRRKKEVNDQQSYLPNRMETLRFPFSRFNIVCISNFREKENSERWLHHRDQVLSISKETLFTIKLTLNTRIYSIDSKSIFSYFVWWLNTNRTILYSLDWQTSNLSFYLTSSHLCMCIFDQLKKKRPYMSLVV